MKTSDLGKLETESEGHGHEGKMKKKTYFTALCAIFKRIKRLFKTRSRNKTKTCTQPDEAIKDQVKEQELKEEEVEEQLSEAKEEAVLKEEEVEVQSEAKEEEVKEQQPAPALPLPPTLLNPPPPPPPPCPNTLLTQPKPCSNTSTQPQPRLRPPLPPLPRNAPPWELPRRCYDGSLAALHEEVLDFQQWASGSQAEFERRMVCVQDVRRVVAALWPAACVEVTGSLANGLYLPDSDIDLTLLGQWPARPAPLPVLRDVLLQQCVAAPGSVTVLGSATVPLVKFVHQQTGVHVDVSLGGEAAVRAAALVVRFEHQFPSLAPLVMVVRQYLRRLGLAEVFSGGVSSYSVVLMAVSFLQLQVPWEAQHDLGWLVVQFFSFYGYEFSYSSTGISVLHGGRYLRKEDVPTVMPGGHRRADLCIQDPLTSGNDVGRSSHRIWEVQRAFQHAYQVLAPALYACGIYGCPWSMLGQLLRPPDQTHRRALSQDGHRRH